MKFYKTFFIAVLAVISTLGYAENTITKTDAKLIIDEWLYSGTIGVKLPVSNNEKDINGKAFDEKKLLKFSHLDLARFRPDEGTSSRISSSNWEKVWANEGEVKFASAVNSDSYGIQYFVCYIEARRFLKAKINIESSGMFEVYLNGKAMGGVYSFDSEKGFEKELTFEKQNYTLVLKVLSKSGDDENTFSANITTGEDYSINDLKVWINPQQYMDIAHVLEGPRIKSIKVSADGQYYLAQYSEVTSPKGKTKKWLELYELKTKKLIWTVRDYTYRNISWLPIGHQFSYVNADGLWVSNAKTGQHRLLIDGFEGSDYMWSEDASFIIYSKSEDGPKKDKLAQKLENMQDHWPWWRSRSFLYKYDLQTGLNERLTFGNLATDLHDIRPDGKRLIYSESVIDNSERPFSKQYLYELDLQTLALDTIWVKPFGGSVIYSPDGMKILVAGSPAMFGEIGMNLIKQKLPNDYDNQAYIYNLKDKSVKAITREFDPKIQEVFWKNESTIYFKVEEKTYRNLYKYNVAKDKFHKIETDQDILADINFSKHSKYAGFISHGINQWNKAYLIDLDKEKTELVLDPEKEFFKNVKFGEIKDWVYTKEGGTELDGFVYYPPDFNPDQKYPVIVYYYAGTSPINRSFRGRYPKELYTAHGYIVYVVNPSGATGYGQEFSAAHVNNWGNTVADEIIKATKYFTANHEYVNKDKIGCMGASYGGFMTMLLMTKTDIFATGISHAGISSISSYWGEGYWGYLYSSTASANSYPWNNKELYVDQSALFNADKQVNSLLLLHGGSDMNVPVGESIQHFAALRLLGKEVEFVNIPGEDHWILDYKKRVAWQKTIAAWFDRELKDQPEWWDDLYPDPNLK